MSDPYAEATRHERRRFSPLAKFLLIGGGLGAVAVIAVAVVAVLQLRRVVDNTDRQLMEATLHNAGLGADAEVYADMLSAAVREEEGRAYFGSVEAYLAMRSSLGRPWAGRRAQRGGQASQEIDLDLDLSDLDLADLQLSDRALSDLRDQLAHAKAQFGHVLEDGFRIEAEGDEHRVMVTARDGSGRMILSVRGNSEGGVVRLHDTDGGTRLKFGDDADPTPGWVPMPPGSTTGKRLFSGETESAEYGVAALHSDLTAREAHDWYADELNAGPWDSGSTKASWSDRRQRGQIMAKRGSEGRERSLMVLVSESKVEGAAILVMHRRER